ncbi:FMN-binding protein [Aeromicrobium sp. CF4.19]|uniref:FMN-binding protein n=1 Tax=Aeromicrobium sp. CF4.19 TaxID=3373082 RepID=UPI003EE555B7
MSLPRLAKPFLTAVAATAVLTTAACGGDAAEDDSSGAGSTESTESTEDSEDSGGEGSGDYEDGTYEASGSYSNPSGTSEVSVELTLEGNAVTDITVTPEASGTSGQFQGQFAGGIADEVVGKDLDELDVSKVAGSSLTSGGFNSALDDIKADASA